LGIAIITHLVPFQDSASGSDWLMFPTAVQAEREEHDTADRP